MTAEIKSLASDASPPTAARFEPIRLILLRYADVWWMLALALLTAVYSLQYDILRQPIPHDTTFHIYAAQQMLAGHPIYRDVAIIKAPLSDFAAAFAILMGRMIPISDIMATRLLSLLSVMAATSVTYLAGSVLFRSRAVGVIAGLVMASWNFYGLRAVTGPEPKEFLITFALLSMIFIAKKRWVWAGVCAGLSTLAWQPALMMQAIAMGAALVEGGPNTDDGGRSLDCARIRAPLGTGSPGDRGLRIGLRQSGRVVVGFVLAFVPVLVYLGVNGALGAAFNATIGANVLHFAGVQARLPLLALMDTNLAEIISDGSLYCFSYNEQWLLGAGAVGFFGLVGAQIVKGVRTRRLDLATTPMILYGLGFAVFSLIDFDYCPDLIPLMPVLALGVGWLTVTCARGVGAVVGRGDDGGQTTDDGRQTKEGRRTTDDGRRVEMLVVAGVGLGLIWVYWLDVWGYQITGTSFVDQLEVVQAVREYLQPGDRVLTFGNTIVPVELHMSNATKILHLGSKSGLGVLAFEPGGVEGMLTELERDPPRVVTLARETRLVWTEPIYEWLERRYEPGPVFGRANMRILILRE